MIFGKNNEESFDFDSFKKDVNAAAEPLVEAVRKYEPNKKKRASYKSPVADLPESAGMFFQAAADTLDKLKTNNTNGATDVRLDKFGQTAQEAKEQASQKTGWLLGKASDATDNAGKSIKDAKLDKKMAKLGDNVTGSIKDAKLDKKLSGLTDSVTGSIKDAKLDKKLGNLSDNVTGSIKDAKLDKKFGDLANNVSGTVKDAKLDKKLAKFGDNVTSTVKDARLDQKASDFAGTVGDTVAPIAATVADTVSTVAGNALDAVSNFIKDNQLDKKAADAASSAGTTLSDATDRAGKAIKDAKLDKKLADAQLPEKFFTAANIIPGVTIKNPKKAAKQFRKARAEAFKTAKKQQRDLSKTLMARQKDASKLLSATQQDAGKILASGQKDAQKYVQDRQKDLQKVNLSNPLVQTKKKASPWGRTGLYLAGAGLTYGGLAANNARIWNAIPPLESKLTGESRYYNSRQGLVFYKEAGQEQPDKTPVVFVHGIGAGNHSYEWLHNFEAFSKQHKVYAYDLLGFGNSAKPNIKYTAEVYIKQLTEFLDEVVGQPAYVVGSSLSAAYAVQVAYRRPELVKKLLLVSPTGINKEAGKSGVQLLPSIAYSLLRLPVLGKAIYSLIAGEADIRHFAEEQMFHDKSLVTDDLVKQYHTAGHQPGSEFAPPSFFTGLLDAEIGQTLGKLDKPVIMFFGKQSKITPIWEAEALKKQNPQAQLEEVDNARLLVQWEQAEKFNWLGLEFLSKPDAPTKPADATTKAGVGLGQTGTTTRTVAAQPDKTQKATDTVKEAAKNGTDTVKEAAKNATDTVKQTAADTGDKIKEAADKLADEFKADAKAADNAVQDRMGKEAQQTDLKQAQAITQDQPKIQSPTPTTVQSNGQPQTQAPQIGNGDLAQNTSHFNQQAGASKTQTAETMDAAVEYPGDHDLKKELRQHRETFIGDNESGAALVEDKDNNGVDDRRMGPPLG